MGQATGTSTSTAPPGGPPADERCVVFRAGTLLAGLPLRDVVETLRPLPVRPLAGTQPFVRGLTILRGRPAPVVDVGLLLTAHEAPVQRYLAVGTARGPVALATGEVLGLRHPDGDTVQRNVALLGPAAARLVDAVGSLDGEPLFLLHSLAVVPDAVWAAVAAAEREPAADGAPA